MDETSEQRPNVRWDNDFGPNRPMWQRYLMAAAAMTFVIGFLGAVIYTSHMDADAAEKAPLSNIEWVVFAGVIALVFVISLKAENWAIRLRHRLKRIPPPTDLD